MIQDEIVYDKQWLDFCDLLDKPDFKKGKEIETPSGIMSQASGVSSQNVTVQVDKPNPDLEPNQSFLFRYSFQKIGTAAQFRPSKNHCFVSALSDKIWTTSPGAGD